MKEDYVSFEIAKLLKEKGFDWDCIMVYDLERPKSCADGKLYDNFDNKNPNRFPDLCSAPSLAMAMKWLREKHNIHITIDYDICDSFDFYSIIRIKSEESWKTYVEYEDEGSNTYEEAVEKAVEYCLTNLI